MASARVDGNDVVAVYNATKVSRLQLVSSRARVASPRSRQTVQAARQRIIETGEPALLELMTYR